MKKSELKEMIRQAMLEENQSTLPNSVKESIKGIGSDGSYNYELEDTLGDLIDNKDQAIDTMMYIAASWRINIQSDLKGLSSSFLEVEVTEAKKDKEEEEEEEDIEIEDIEDTEEVEDIEVEETPPSDDLGITGEERKVQDSLESALIAAKKLGDEKLINQIGNSITFFTRAHVVGSGEESLDEEIEGDFKEEVVTYKGEDHVITRKEGDRIYLRRKADSAMLGKMDEFWVKSQDLEEGMGMEDLYERKKMLKIAGIIK